MRAAVVISADAEWLAFKECLPDLHIEPSPYGQQAQINLGSSKIPVLHGGWGKISAAASAQYIIDQYQPDLLVNLGTCGGFAGRVETGTILLVERTLIYDILEQMGDAEAALEHYATRLDLSWLPAELPYLVRRGLLVSADRDLLAEDIPMLAGRFGAVAADWESGAIAWVAQRNHLRCLILRGVSDLVGTEGGEAYGNIELFHERTRSVMSELLRQLPGWLQACGVSDAASLV